MREILFRGQTRRKGEYIVNMAGDKCESNWVYGGIFPQNKDGDFAIIYQQEPEIRKFTVYADTVGQYTGLTDKNGKKIFEGDILRGFEYPFCSNNNGEFNYFAEIVWFDDSSAFGIYTFKNPKSNVRGILEGNTDYLEYFNADKWEVIGNIHDNPEILKTPSP